ncbi:hypothetical protein C0Q70_21670 [Pomacea canaliculata]|uniref:Acyltransferase n=1 Tax=Pomacea canaliculata TaxID=400727 RepID=A0A2T7ND55_POMCA|nr:2-acylglycerol O-acyltransferase 2-like [Pomacea canaliculata]XP_025079644.1 2-acylglycerol O-acyltransferase 2-like [Pomacea canaliculata]XP_025079645.1 2-acylglycerol O-acyltransferase 2-like [Pomacea canaliculata]XP_025079646.1 2-acylglycerol O-acyltransferase 2-like [Pomacea canaliculata]XP_025079647.1 2-acylglycerol O-acyltransferase 2-like [Pomacea canaliculata]XP_025079648.1 2-acylglycerol O-acyltransferase 2-like [Pomacea canaliculata]PVD19110.1 hypothetical protein C0Q70_21670 [Po
MGILAQLILYGDSFKQMVGVLQFSMSFLFLGWSSSIIMVAMLFTSYWYLPLLYATWYYYDRHTQLKGGRRSDTVRRWRVWRYYRDYFPYKLIKTADLPADRNYIFACHPHGIMCFAPFLTFSTEASGFTEIFPGLTPYLLTSSTLHKYPLFREYFMLSGAVDASKESFKHLLTCQDSGQALGLVVGGAAEALEAAPGRFLVKLEDRKGFIKMALKYGASIVPVYSFGEEELFKLLDRPEGSWITRFQRLVTKIFRISLPVFYGRAIGLYMVPFKEPIFTVVGEPIHVQKVEKPSPELVDELHARYRKALEDLFETHKYLRNIPAEQHLNIK